MGWAKMGADGEPVYEVQELLQDRWCQERGTEFLVRWVGYGPEADTWEPEAHLGGRRGAIITKYQRACLAYAHAEEAEEEEEPSTTTLLAAGWQFHVRLHATGSTF